MPKTQTSAVAVVVMTVKIDITQAWGADCTLAQVQKQAGDQARGMLEGLTRELASCGIRIGVIQSMRILLNEERSDT